MSGGPDLVAVFLRWTWWRAVLHRGWWLAASVYLVVDAHLSPSQLVLIGVAQGVIALVFEVPAGVVADTFSRKWSLVVSHVLMGTAMIATGLVTDFGALVATQMLWGLSWTFASGAALVTCAALFVITILLIRRLGTPRAARAPSLDRDLFRPDFRRRRPLLGLGQKRRWG